METYNLSEYDRFLIAGLTESNNRLAAAIEGNRREAPDILFTCKQAAIYLEMSSSTISRMLADGRLHKVNENGLIGIRKSELDKFKH